MTKAIYIFIYLTTLLVYACSGSVHDKNQTLSGTNQGNEKHADSSAKLLQSRQDVIKGADPVSFRINTYSNYETYFRLEKPTGYVISSFGARGIEVAESDNEFLQKTSFALQDSCYVVHFIYSGSTYGAELAVIIWYGYGKWNLFTLPFERFEIKDINDDDLKEIINYEPSKKVFRFNSGCLEEI